MKKIALIAASLAILATPVLAEDAKTTGNAPAEAKFSTVQKDEMFSSKLKGLNVTNQKDESVGEIMMPSTLRAMASCAFLSWVEASLCESYVVTASPRFWASPSMPLAR